MSRVSASCRLCASRDLQENPRFPGLTRVGSDCRPFKAGGRLSVCIRCGLVQKPHDQAFVEDCDEIYSDYALYHQGQGEEQRIFDQRTGCSRPRSAMIVEALRPLLESGPPGRLLDYGCGEGHFLRTFHEAFPRWRLSGLEQDSRYRSSLMRIPGMEEFLTTLEPGAETWDVVSMNHSLEHIPAPASLLRELRGRVQPNGILEVNVPHYGRNPWDLLIADHASHFDAGSLRGLLGSGGFEPLEPHKDRIPKEWLLLALKTSHGEEVAAVAPAEEVEGIVALVDEQLAWLERFAAEARDLRAKESVGGVGILGTAIAGVWLQATLSACGRGADFFVDEDPARSGTSFMDRPVYTPSQTPRDTTVILPFPRPIAEKIAARLASHGLRLLPPPH